jgi:hypothetical protein
MLRDGTRAGMGKGNDKRQQQIMQLLIGMRGADACQEFIILPARKRPTYLSQRSSGSSPLHSRLSLPIVGAINLGVFVVTACDRADAGESRHH